MSRTAEMEEPLLDFAIMAKICPVFSPSSKNFYCRKKHLFSAFVRVICLAIFCALSHLLSVWSVGLTINTDSASVTSYSTASSQALVLVFTEGIDLINWPRRKALRASQNTPGDVVCLLILTKSVMAEVTGSGVGNKEG